mgnify:CR=1 FL=1
MLPGLSKEFINLIVAEYLSAGELTGRAVFHPPTQDFLIYLNAACDYNRAHRAAVAQELVQVLAGYPQLSISKTMDNMLVLLLSLKEIYNLDHHQLDTLLSKVKIEHYDSPNDQYWAGQNHPIWGMDPSGFFFSVLPLLAPFFQYEEDAYDALLPRSESYGWDDSLINSIAWANNAYKIVYVTPSDRYGGIPEWFPETDQHGRRLSQQAQADRFLSLLYAAYGGFVGEHIDINPRHVAGAILKLQEEWEEYIEAEDGIEWELAVDKPDQEAG